MKNNLLGGLLLAGLLAAPMAAQMPEGYLDVNFTHVKFGKRADFDANIKRMVEINRKNKGDNWLAYELAYGESNVVYFTSTRSSFGAVEDAGKAFEGALTKALGAPGMRKLFDDTDADSESERQELRRRRWDLSAGAPADTAAYSKLVGQSRWIRVAIARVRPGRVLDYEAELKRNKAAQERANPGIAFFVSQGVAGQATGIFYISTLVKSLGDLDKIKTLQEVLGSNYANYQKAVAEMVLGTEIIVGRFLPELSNPPDEVVAADANFWRPKPPAPVAPKTAPKK